MREIRTELHAVLEAIECNLDNATSDEENAILLNAKVNALIALQKYEEESK